MRENWGEPPGTNPNKLPEIFVSLESHQESLMVDKNNPFMDGLLWRGAEKFLSFRKYGHSLDSKRVGQGNLLEFENGESLCNRNRKERDIKRLRSVTLYRLGFVGCKQQKPTLAILSLKGIYWKDMIR